MSSVFKGTQNLFIAGGNFVASSSGKGGFDLLREGSAPGAFHDSAERFDAPKCHPGTHTVILDAIMAWIKDGQKTSSIMWLDGPAGAGKSAIAQAIAEICHEQGILAASFFWSRSATGRNDETRLIASLVYQLILSIPDMRSHVEAALEYDPLLLSRSSETQMEYLVVRPLRKICLELDTEPRLIILDGLDECGTASAQGYILKVISSCIPKIPIPITFLIASRPAQGIRDFFNLEAVPSTITRFPLDDGYKPNDDVKVFLVDQFNSLQNKYALQSGPTFFFSRRLELYSFLRWRKGRDRLTGSLK